MLVQRVDTKPNGRIQMLLTTYSTYVRASWTLGMLLGNRLRMPDVILMSKKRGE